MRRPGKFRIAEPPQPEENRPGQPDPDVGRAVLKAAAVIHHDLGPGLERAAYAARFQKEMEKSGYRVARDVPVPVTLADSDPMTGFYIDILIEDTVMVVLRDMNDEGLRQAVLKNYMRLSSRDFGFMICFDVPDIRQGIIQASRRAGPVMQGGGSIN